MSDTTNSAVVDVTSPADGADPWALLGVPWGASPDDIRAAYARQLEALRAQAATGHSAGSERLAAAQHAFHALLAMTASAPAETSTPALLPPLEAEVKFQTFLHQDSRFTGKGTVRLEGERLEVAGRLRRPFAFVRRRWGFALADARNASRDGGRVSFVLVGPGKPWRAMLVFADAGAAERFWARLPRTREESLITVSDAHQDLELRLADLGRGTPVTWTLLVLNLMLYGLVGANGGGWNNVAPEHLTAWGGNLGPLTTGGQWWRMLSAIFLHNGLMHLAGNLIALYAFGRLAERIYGSWPFAVLYLLSGLVGSTATLVFHPDAVGVGASGAIFGVIGLMLAFLTADRELLPPAGRRQLLINWAVFAVYVFAQGMGTTGVDNAAHGAGLVTGLVLGFILGNPLRHAGGGIPLLSGRMGVGALVCGLAVFGGSLAAPHLGVDYRARGELVEISRQLAQAERQLDATGKRLAADGASLSPAAAVESLRAVQGNYAGLEQQLAQVRIQGAEVSRRRELMLRFVRLRQTGLGGMSAGLERDDPALVQQGVADLKEAAGLVPEMVKPLKWAP